MSFLSAHRKQSFFPCNTLLFRNIYHSVRFHSFTVYEFSDEKKFILLAGSVVLCIRWTVSWSNLADYTISLHCVYKLVWVESFPRCAHEVGFGIEYCTSDVPNILSACVPRTRAFLEKKVNAIMARCMKHHRKHWPVIHSIVKV